MDAWDHYLRGMWGFYRFTPEDHIQAERLMRRAVELAPTFAQGHVGLARILNSRVMFGWSENPQADWQAAYAAARRAVELDEKDPYAHYILAFASMLIGEHENAVAEAQKAIDLTPNFALGYFGLGMTRVFLGRFDQVADPFRRAMRLSPHEPLTFFFANFSALAEYHQGHHEEAARIARMGIGIRPFHTLYRVLAACYGQLGRTEEARAALTELRRLTPKHAARLWEVAYPYADPAHRAHLIDGLRKAGWTES
jgi:tetratricopeptide (TPR) repeat protein